MWHMYKCAIKHHLSSLAPDTYFESLTKLCMNVNIRYAVILLFHDFHLRGRINYTYESLNTCGIIFIKHDYCLKHFKLVFDDDFIARSSYFPSSRS